jgi:ribosome-interacting GTPase 1
MSYWYADSTADLCPLDQISIEELDIIYKIPHCVPISAHHKWNFDDLLEKMWEYLKLVRMYVSVFAFSRYTVLSG